MARKFPIPTLLGIYPYLVIYSFVVFPVTVANKGPAEGLVRIHAEFAKFKQVGTEARLEIARRREK